MKGDRLPDPDHVLRYVSPSHLDHGEVAGSAFYSRPRDENMTSFNWMECCAAKIEDQVSEIRGRQRLTLKKTGSFAMLNVGAVLSALKEAFPDDCKSEFIHDPLEAEDPFVEDDSHALMTHMPYMPPDGDPLVEAMGDVIADCVMELFPAVL
jgi:hypothetical protein